ncbi:hypothetical protein M427DRAFT_69527 [Gonapodya prolifera JEL478]|uniref:Methyltransferase domain-containing protein n=1 Tax=Gonapodya prolifera (strain JEL478) TaxID=1344416 RepID=A0A139AHB4_GONPJ|nr:hypothetical protein M427DRAFT_69527 [Gonapodya prolifera JEL478]|eukprot:KXS16212.1 hypothetical protein M427DRAFT_69527 [Gonapodya prolifera JEL478]
MSAPARPASPVRGQPPVVKQNFKPVVQNDAQVFMETVRTYIAVPLLVLSGGLFVTSFLAPRWGSVSKAAQGVKVPDAVHQLAPSEIGPIAFGSLLLAIVFLLSAIYLTYDSQIKPTIVFAWNVFLKPLVQLWTHHHGDHQARLEAFYKDQASVYDQTRRRLLRGRSTMLKLAAAQLKQYYPAKDHPTPLSIASLEEKSLHTTSYKRQLYRSLASEIPKALPPASKGTEEVDGSASPEVLPSPPDSPEVGANIGLGGVSGKTKVAWVDVGGGTGENIERMNAFYHVSNFDVVYLVDITPSLCEVARRRFERLGWANVRVICGDAEKFEIPAEDGGAEGVEVALITLSYSLSMLETIFPIVDALSQLLSLTGIIAVADFYAPPKRAPQDPSRERSWFGRWFWQMWFDADNVYLQPHRREYLEHKFATVKTVSALNYIFWPFIRIPYYVYLGCRKDGLLSPFALDEIESAVALTESLSASVAVGNNGSITSDASPRLTPSNLFRSSSDDDFSTSNDFVPGQDSPRLRPTELKRLTSTDRLTLAGQGFVHGQGMRWRQPFDARVIPNFSTYLYAFAWEDPRTDIEALNLQPDDRMMVITSGGCNALEYVIKGIGRIHCVDMNPCQNNMLELKLAALSSLDYADFWQLFGEGYHPRFRSLLDSHLSPYLSSHALQYWKTNSGFSNLFKTGGSGMAVRVFQMVSRIGRLKKHVLAMCEAETLEEQKQIWAEKIRPVFLSNVLIKVLDNPKFHWVALGVPPRQMAMLLEEGTSSEYIIDTIDPVIEQTHLKTDNYFYYSCLMMKYNKQSCPTYLKEDGFNELKNNPSKLDAIQIHTDSIVNVLNTKVQAEELTKVILMDHLDWFDRAMLMDELTALTPKVKTGGQVFWRSAAKYPWYNAVFEELGYEVKAIQIRQPGSTCIDRVNMYASFYVGTKKPVSVAAA